LNENHADAASRATANRVAASMAGDAGDAVARGIAKSLLPSLGGDAKPPAILELFATGKGDLSNEVKTALASYVYGCAVVFDSATGLLSDTPDPPPSNAAPLSAPRLSDPYRHPSAKVAAAWDNYQAELQAYIGPPPARPRPSPHTESAGPKPRPGWKS
jgi:hypothetical protein